MKGIRMNTHELADQLLTGPDVPAVVPAYDDEDEEQHVEVTTSEPLPEGDRWFDSSGFPHDDPAVAIRTSDD